MVKSTVPLHDSTNTVDSDRVAKEKRQMLRAVDEDDDEINGNEEEDAHAAKVHGEVKVRRQIRADQRKMIERLEADAAQLSNVENGQFSELCEENNAIFKKVTHTRELLLDGEIFNKATEVIKAAAMNADDISKRYDFGSYAEALSHKFVDRGSSHFNWAAFGQDIGSLVCGVPSFSVMLGPLSKPVKVAKQRLKRTALAAVVATKCDEVEQKEGEDQVRGIFHMSVVLSSS